MTQGRDIRRAALPGTGRAWLTVSVGLLAALIAVIYGGVVEVLSRANPLHLEWRDAVEAEIRDVLPVEGGSIHVQRMLAGSPGTRLYALPWSIDMAPLPQAVPSDTPAPGTTVQMTMPFNIDGRAPGFSVISPPVLRDRDHEGSAIIYQPPDEGT